MTNDTQIKIEGGPSWDWRARMNDINHEALDQFICDETASEPSDTDILVDMYDKANNTERDLIDRVLVCITGWGLPSLLKQSQPEEEKETGLPRNFKPETALFTGTEQYHRHLFGKFTDGVAWLAENKNCFWMLDVVFSHMVEVYRNPHISGDQKRLLVCKFQRTLPEGVSMDDIDDGYTPVDNACTFTMDDGNDNILATQQIEFTDFGAMQQEIWIQNGVAMLPSEY